MGSSPIVIAAGKERAALTGVWRSFYEDPVGALSTAEFCAAAGQARGDSALVVRATVMSAAVAIHRGQFELAGRLLAQARASAGDAPDPRTGSDLSAVTAQNAFLSGDYDLATMECQRAIALADESGDLEVRIRARRITCMVYGNLQLPECRRLVNEGLELAALTDEPWEEAVSRNDLACALLEEGKLVAAERETRRGLTLLGPAGWGNTFAAAVIHSTRADVHLAAERWEEALADAERSVGMLLSFAEPDPYVLSITVRAQIQALIALGRAADASAVGAATLERIGDRTPHSRSRLMLRLAEALRETGYAEEADRTAAEARALQSRESQSSEPGQPPRSDPTRPA